MGCSLPRPPIVSSEILPPAAPTAQPLEVAAFGLPRLLGLAGRLLTENAPEAREAGRRLVGLLAAAFAGGAVAAGPSTWEQYCRQALSGSAALAVLKVSEAQ